MSIKSVEEIEMKDFSPKKTEARPQRRDKVEEVGSSTVLFNPETPPLERRHPLVKSTSLDTVLRPFTETELTDVDATSFETTIHPPTEPDSDGKVSFELHRKGSSSGADTTTLKPYHMVEWDGKKIRLTQVHNDGKETRQVGLTEAEWESIAKEQIALWDAAKKVNNLFHFSQSSLHVESGTWKFCPAAGQPVETVDLGNPSSTPTSQYAIPSLRTPLTNTQNLFKKHLVKPTLLAVVHGNPPKIALPSEPKPLKKDPMATPPLPAPPPVEEIPWYRIDKKFSAWWNKPKPEETA
jgi:hypothetical protein